MNDFVHLHCKSEFSLENGLFKIKDFVEEAKKKNMNSIALTDTNNLFGAIKFYKNAITKGIKPIIGSELYIDNTYDKDTYFKIIFLCQNNEGYKNLCEIISKIHLYKKKIKKLSLPLNFLNKSNTSGIIAIAPSINSDIYYFLLKNNLKSAESSFKYWKKLFEDRFYISITRTQRKNEEIYINNIIDFTNRNNCTLIATNDVCMLTQKDFDAYKVRICINEKQTINNCTKLSLYSKQQYLKTSEEINQIFKDVPNVIKNTLEVSKRCNLILNLNKVHLPKFQVPKLYTVKEYLNKLSKKKLSLKLKKYSLIQNKKLKYKEVKNYLNRLNHELNIINRMKFSGYFLIVADFISWAKKNEIAVGPGRGSGAGSLVAYSLNITDIDPIKYDLLFERFLNPKRISMPDFDIDFCMEEREKVIEYVEKKYKKESVSQIITFGTMAAKGVVRDVGRILGYPYGFVDKIAKLIPNEIGISLKKSLDQEKELKNLYQREEEVRKIIKLGYKLEGITRNIGKHAGGILIAPEKITSFMPLYYDENDDQFLTQFDKDDIEQIGLIKFDFLGLRTLTIINYAIKLIKINKNKHINIEEIPINDKKTFKLLNNCLTTAIFQMESYGIKKLIYEIKINKFEEIIDLIAIFRPGPLQSGMVRDFIDRKLGKKEIKYIHYKLKDILNNTYGVILYQEQVMKIAQVLAGYTLAEADLLRRAMGKKKQEEMLKQKDRFIKGAVSKNIPKSISERIFFLIEKFSGYGFNKSHSTAYALISYRSLWLKSNYTIEFMAAVLSADMTNTEKIFGYVMECKDLNLIIEKPNINNSYLKFSVKNNKILFGLGAIKGINTIFINELIINRNKHGKFLNLYNFISRINLKTTNKKTIESLIKSGAFDCFNISREKTLNSLNDIMLSSEKIYKSYKNNQLDIFKKKIIENNIDIQMKKEFNYKEKNLIYEKETLGLYLNEHPIDKYINEINNIITTKIKDLNFQKNKKHIISGFIIAVKKIITKKNNIILICTIDDKTARQDVFFFEKSYEKNKSYLIINKLVILFGNLKKENNFEKIKFIVSKVVDIDTVRNKLSKNIILYFNENLSKKHLEYLQSKILMYKDRNCYLQIFKKNNLIILNNIKKINPTENLINFIKKSKYIKCIKIIY